MNYKARQDLTRSSDNICVYRVVRVPWVSFTRPSGDMDLSVANFPRQCQHRNQSPSPVIEIKNWQTCEERAVYSNPLSLDS